MDFAVPGRKVSERLDRNERFCKAEFRRNEKGREIYPAFFRFFGILYFFTSSGTPNQLYTNNLILFLITYYRL